MDNHFGINANLITLKSFIIKRFIILLCFIAVEERGIYFLYNYVVFPFLKDFFGENKFGISYTKSGMLLGVTVYLFLMLLKCIIDIMPSVFSIPFSFLYGKAMEFLNVDTEIFVLNQKVSQEAGIWIRICYIAIILLLLVIAIFPYVISIIIYSKSVSRKVQEQEIQLEKQRNLLLADIAHDLKTPLTSITGYAQALQDDVEESEEKKRQYIDTIHKKAVRMDEMVSLLFEYVKLGSAGFELKKEKENIAEIVREAVAELFVDFENKGITLEIDIPEKPIFESVDKMQVIRAVTNLLNNSLKHNETGDTVLVKVEKEEDIEITIADNGVQISDEIAETIFEPFAMGDKSRNSRNGSGLGLSIAYSIAKMHGGYLELNRKSTNEFTKAFVIHL